MSSSDVRGDVYNMKGSSVVSVPHFAHSCAHSRTGQSASCNTALCAAYNDPYDARTGSPCGTFEVNHGLPGPTDNGSQASMDVEAIFAELCNPATLEAAPPRSASLPFSSSTSSSDMRAICNAATWLSERPLPFDGSQWHMTWQEQCMVRIPLRHAEYTRLSTFSRGRLTHGILSARTLLLFPTGLQACRLFQGMVVLRCRRVDSNFCWHWPLYNIMYLVSPTFAISR